MKDIAMLIALALLLAGCDQNMDVQPKYSEYSPRAPVSRQRVAQNPPRQVARDDLERDAEKLTKPSGSRRNYSRAATAVRHFLFALSRRAMAAATASSCSAACRVRPAITTIGYALRRISTSSTSLPTAMARCIPTLPACRRATAGRSSPISGRLQLSRHASIDDVPPDQRASLTAVR